MPHPMDYRQPAPAYNAVPDGDLFVLPGATVMKDDLLTLFESGLVLPADPVLGASLAVNSTAGMSALTAPYANIGANYRMFDGEITLAELPNKNIAHVYAGNGTTENTGVNLQILNQWGVTLLAPVVVVSTTAISSCRVYATVSGKILVVWGEGTNGLRFAIYNSDLTVSVAATSLPGQLNIGAGGYSVAILRNTDIVFAFYKVTSTDMVFRRYSEAGALQGSEVVIEAAAQPGNVGITACANGDFAVIYVKNTAAFGFKIARYTNTNTIVGSLTIVYAAATVLNGSSLTQIVESPTSGTLAFWAANAVDTAPRLYFYSGALALLRVATPSLAVSAVNAALCLTSTGGFASSHFNSNSQYTVRTYDDLGRVLIGETIAASIAAPTASSQSQMQIFNLGAAGFALWANSQNTSGSSYEVKAVSINPRLIVAGSQVQLESASATLASRACAILTSNNVLMAAWGTGSTTNLRLTAYAVQRATPIGVAKTSGVAGATNPVQVGIKGTFRINQNMGAFAAFNTRSNVVGAQSGIVNGFSAILYGPTA